MEIDIEIPGPLAFDRRSTDRDGRLTATECVLTRANVCGYLGSEIPECEQLGLRSDQLYQLYRDPVALRAAMPGLNGKPLMIAHVVVNASDPQQMMVAGTVHDCRWEGDRIVGTVSVWQADAIAAIESGALKDLSCGYHYKCVMAPGVAPDGTPFDGRMRSIEFNHIALVDVGRVDGAFVSDSAPDRRSALAKLIPNFYRLP